MSLEQKLGDKMAYKGKVTSLLGTLPKGALKDPKTLPVNSSFEKGRYQDYVLDTEKAVDQTGASQSRTQG